MTNSFFLPYCKFFSWPIVSIPYKQPQEEQQVTEDTKLWGLTCDFRVSLAVVMIKEKISWEGLLMTPWYWKTRSWGRGRILIWVGLQTTLNSSMNSSCHLLRRGPKETVKTCEVPVPIVTDSSTNFKMCILSFMNRTWKFLWR